MHFVYVASGVDWVKVGVTTKPKSRARALIYDFRRLGDAMTRIVFMPGLHAGFGVESSICRELSALADHVHGREWFAGIQFDEAVGITRQMVMSTRRFQLINPRLFAATGNLPRKPKPIKPQPLSA